MICTAPTSPGPRLCFVQWLCFTTRSMVLGRRTISGWLGTLQDCKISSQPVLSLKRSKLQPGLETETCRFCARKKTVIGNHHQIYQQGSE